MAVTEAEIDNTLDLLDTFAARHGGGREQACFHAARIIRHLHEREGRVRAALAELRQAIDDVRTVGAIEEIERLAAE